MLRPMICAAAALATTVSALAAEPASRPVTDRMIQQPEAGEWLTWRGNLAPLNPGRSEGWMLMQRPSSAAGSEQEARHPRDDCPGDRRRTG